MAFAQRWHGVHHDLKASTPRRFDVFTVCHLSYCFPVAFDRRCHGIREALSRRLLRSRCAITYRVRWCFFLMKIDEKNMQILNMTKANKTLLKLDAHACIRISFTVSIEQQAGLLLVYMQAQQIQIAAYAASIVL